MTSRPGCCICISLCTRLWHPSLTTSLTQLTFTGSWSALCYIASLTFLCCIQTWNLTDKPITQVNFRDIVGTPIKLYFELWSNLGPCFSVQSCVIRCVCMKGLHNTSVCCATVVHVVDYCLCVSFYLKWCALLNRYRPSPFLYERTFHVEVMPHQRRPYCYNLVFSQGLAHNAQYHLYCWSVHQHFILMQRMDCVAVYPCWWFLSFLQWLMDKINNIN